MNTSKLLILTILILFSCSETNVEIDGNSYFYENKKDSQGLLKNGLKVGAWKKIENDSIIKVEYFYNDKYRFDLDKKDFILNSSPRRINENFLINYPKHWDSVDTKGASLFSMRKPLDSTHVFLPTFSLTEFSLKENDSIDNIATQLINELSKDKLKIIQKRLINSNSKDYSGYKVVFISNHNNLSFGNILFLLKKNTDSTITSFTGTCLTKNNHFIKYKSVFEEVFYTIRDNNENSIFDKIDVLY